MQKYKQLTGICKKEIEAGRCLGCNRLELAEFEGLEKCNYVKDPIKQIKEILGIQESFYDL